MSTYAEIQDRVSGNIIDLPTFVTNEVPKLINSAMVSLQKAHNFKVMEGLVSAEETAADDPVLMALPARFKEWRGKPWYVADSGTTHIMSIAPTRESIIKSFSADRTGPPQYLLLAEPVDANTETPTLSVFPIPDGGSDWGNGEYRIYIPYWKYLAPLSADADTNWFTVNAEDYLVEKATSLGFQRDHNYDAMAIWAQTAEMWKKEIIKADKLLRLSGVETLVSHWEGVNVPKVNN